MDFHLCTLKVHINCNIRMILGGCLLQFIACSDVFIFCQKGNVSIVARPEMRIEIPEGVVLENKVWLQDS